MSSCVDSTHRQALAATCRMQDPPAVGQHFPRRGYREPRSRQKKSLLGSRGPRGYNSLFPSHPISTSRCRPKTQGQQISRSVNNALVHASKHRLVPPLARSSSGGYAIVTQQFIPSRPPPWRRDWENLGQRIRRCNALASDWSPGARHSQIAQ